MLMGSKDGWASGSAIQFYMIRKIIASDNIIHMDKIYYVLLLLALRENDNDEIGMELLGLRQKQENKSRWTSEK